MSDLEGRAREAARAQVEAERRVTEGKTMADQQAAESYLAAARDAVERWASDVLGEKAEISSLTYHEGFTHHDTSMGGGTSVSPTVVVVIATVGGLPFFVRYLIRTRTLEPRYKDMWGQEIHSLADLHVAIERGRARERGNRPWYRRLFDGRP